MSEFVAVGEAEDFVTGAMKLATVDGHEVVVTKIDGGFYAFANECTHAHHPLSFGYIKGREAVCIYHWAIFDATNGAVIQGPAARPLRTYPVKVEDGVVQVGSFE